MSFFRSVPLTPDLLTKIALFKAEQTALRQRIILEPPTQPIKIIAGCDSAFVGDTIVSIFVMFSFPELEEIEIQYHASLATIPYLPGFLSFREIPNLLQAYEKITHQPDLIMVDGQGILHPRRLGIATHLGLLLNKPTIGIAKKKLTGTYEMPNEEPGSYSGIFDHQEQLGYVLRPKAKVKPIFVSPGHLCDLPTALNLTLQTLRKHKLPEPTRLADKYSKDYKSKLRTI